MNSLMTQPAPAILRGAFAIAIGLALTAATAFVADAQSVTLQNRAFQAEISHAGRYSIAVKETGWQFEGALGLQAEQILRLASFLGPAVAVNFGPLGASCWTG